MAWNHLPICKPALWTEEGLQFRWRSKRIAFPPDTPPGLEFRCEGDQRWTGAAPGAIHELPSDARRLSFRYAHRLLDTTVPLPTDEGIPLAFYNAGESETETPPRNWHHGLAVQLGEVPPLGVARPAPASAVWFHLPHDGEAYFLPLGYAWDHRALVDAKALTLDLQVTPVNDMQDPWEGTDTPTLVRIRPYGDSGDREAGPSVCFNRSFAAASNLTGFLLSIRYTFLGPFYPWSVLWFDTGAGMHQACYGSCRLTQFPNKPFAALTTQNNAITLSAGAVRQVAWQVGLGEATRYIRNVAKVDLTAGQLNVNALGPSEASFDSCVYHDVHPAPAVLYLDHEISPSPTGKYSIATDAATAGTVHGLNLVMHGD